MMIAEQEKPPCLPVILDVLHQFLELSGLHGEEDAECTEEKDERIDSSL